MSGVLYLSIAVLATIAAPFGTHEMGIFTRAIFWVLVVILAVPVGCLVRGVTLAIIPVARAPAYEVVGLAIMTLVFSPFVWIAARVTVFYNPERLPGLLEIGLYVTIVTLIVFILRRFARSGPEFQDHTEETDTPRLMRRLPDDAHGPILRLSGRDHHVDVVTTAGAVVLRMRLSDAIAEMDGVNGYCTHRSHWVASAAVVGAGTDDAGKPYLELSNGDHVPVSRKYRPDIESAGLLSS